MLRYSYFCFVFLVFILSPQARSQEGFHAELKLLRSTVLPCEPIPLMMSLRNTLETPQTKQFVGVGILFVKKGENGPWDQYLGAAGTYDVLHGPDKTFQPGEIVNESTIVSLRGDGSHQFLEPGRYWIQGRGIRRTNEALLEVVEPTGDDRAAYEYLLTKPLYRYFDLTGAYYYTYVRRPINFDIDVELANFIEHFPKSRYADWARLAQIYVRYLRLDRAALVRSFLLNYEGKEEALRQKGEQSLGRKYGNDALQLATSAQLDESLNSWQKDAQELSLRIEYPMNFFCRLQSGIMAQKRFGKAQAEEDFLAASKLAQSEIFLDFLNYGRDNTPSYSRGPAVLIYDRALRELESQRYDVKAFIKSSSNAAKEWFAFNSQLASKFGVDSYTLFEQLAAKLKFLVTTTTEPLSVEEWQRRQEEYAKADAKRKAIDKPAAVPNKN